MQGFSTSLLSFGWFLSLSPTVWSVNIINMNMWYKMHGEKRAVAFFKNPPAELLGFFFTCMGLHWTWASNNMNHCVIKMTLTRGNTADIPVTTAPIFTRGWWELIGHRPAQHSDDITSVPIFMLLVQRLLTQRCWHALMNVPSLESSVDLLLGKESRLSK